MEKVILNVGGVKYETYVSTLAQYPNTLLGTMFHERNKCLLKPNNNNNEYFFDRNGKAFHYIMEYYRTGEYLWHPLMEKLRHEHSNSGSDDSRVSESCLLISQKELEKEFDYFQIPYPNQRSYEIGLKHKKTVEEILVCLEGKIYRSMDACRKTRICNFTDDDEIYSHIRTGKTKITNSYKIVQIYHKRIKEELENKFPGLECNYVNVFTSSLLSPVKSFKITLNYDFLF